MQRQVAFWCVPALLLAVLLGGGCDSGGGEAAAGVTNDPPQADAGPDQDVAVGATVSLDGSQSSDPDPEDTLAFA
ncbi:MAG: hypothetical protein GF330_11560 [Candidatus Eisenbacteria bacterium]|nr:hypothetical protein [Candidatus Eisenbacteria bacterium]